MRCVLYPVLGAVALVVVACEGLVPTVDSSISSTTADNSPDAFSMVRAAAENLRAVSSFRVTVDVESSGVVSPGSDIVPVGGRHFLIQVLVDPGNGIEIEVIQAGESQYVLYPGFQAWFGFGGETLDQDPNFQTFPYDLGGIRESAESVELVGEGIIDGVEAYRVFVEGSGGLRRTVGFEQGIGDPEVEMWISKSEEVPLRIEARVEDPETLYTAVYSDFSTDVNGSQPENVIYFGWMDGFMVGALSPEQLGEVVRALPVPGQQCMEAEIGADVYREVIGGDSEEDFLVRDAFIGCESEIFPLRDDP